MTNVESMDYTHSHPSTIASLSSTAQLLPVHYNPPYTFLKTATRPTYYSLVGKGAFTPVGKGLLSRFSNRD